MGAVGIAMDLHRGSRMDHGDPALTSRARTARKESTGRRAINPMNTARCGRRKGKDAATLLGIASPGLRCLHTIKEGREEKPRSIQSLPFGATWTVHGASFLAKWIMLVTKSGPGCRQSPAVQKVVTSDAHWSARARRQCTANSGPSWPRTIKECERNASSRGRRFGATSMAYGANALATWMSLVASSQSSGAGPSRGVPRAAMNAANQWVMTSRQRAPSRGRKASQGGMISK